MGAGELLLVSVIIRAVDGASSVLSMLGLNGIKSMGLLQAAAATTAVAILGIGLYSMKAASDFDYQMQKIAALTTTSAAQMQWYKDQLLAMAPQLDQAPTALAQGLYFVISAGYQGADALNILKLSAQAAAATMTPMKDVADLLTTAMNAYRGSNLSAGHAMDDIIKVVVNGKVQMQNLATSFGFVGVTAHAAGLSFDEASAAVSTLSQIAGAHGSRRVMMDLDNLLRSTGIDVDAVAKRAKGLGLSFDESKYASMSFIEKLQYLATITGGVGYNLDFARIKADLASGDMADLALATAQANSKFKTLVGGAAAFIPAFMLLSDKGAEYNVILKQMGGNGQATADAFKTMRESTGQKWNMFKVTLETIATVIGLHILPVANRLLDFLIKAGHGIIDFLQHVAGMKDLKTTLLGIAAILTAILGPAILGIIAGMAPFVALVAAIVLGGKLLGPIIEHVWQKLGGLHGILQKLHPLLSAIGNALRATGEELKKALADPAIQGALKQLKEELPKLLPILKALAIFVGGVIVVALNLFVAVLHGLLAALPGVIRMIRGLVDEWAGLFRLVKDIFTGKWSDIPKALGQILGGLRNVVSGAFEAIINYIGGYIDHFLHVFGSSAGKLKKAVGDWIAGAGKAIADFFDGIKKWIGGRLDDIGKGIADFAGGLKDKVQDGLNELKKAFLAPLYAIVGAFKWLYDHNYYVKAAVDAVKHAVEWLRDHIQQLITTIKTWLSDRWNDIKRDVQDAWTWIHDHIIAPVQDAITQVQSFVNGVKTWLLGRWNDIKNDIGSVWSNIMSGAGDILTKITTWVTDNIIQPISSAISDIITKALTWGENLVKQFGQGIMNMGGWLKDRAGDVIGGVTHFLGFHSPSPGVPESAYWGPNLIKMFAAGMLSQSALVSTAAQQIILGAANVFAGGASASGGAGMMGGGAGGAGMPLLASAAGGGSTTISHTHNWEGAFPNATDQQQIVAAIRQVQQEDYRRGRRAGGYGGLRAGISG